MARTQHFLLGAGHAVPGVAEAARRYAVGVGNNYRAPSYGGVVTTPSMQASLARAYEVLPEHDPAAEPAFHAMRDETVAQFHHMVSPRSRGGLGLDVQVTDKDPYDGPAPLFQDLFHDRRIKVLGTRQTGSHPFFTDDENDMFRAVHDVFGHAGTGRGFDRHGEEAAYQSHASMYSPLARMALATETRGQNAALIHTGQFQPQKVALLPRRLINPAVTLGARPELEAARHQAHAFNEQQFGTLLGALRQVTT